MPSMNQQRPRRAGGERGVGPGGEVQQSVNGQRGAELGGF